MNDDRQRLSDSILDAFSRAQSAGYEATAWHLRNALESLLAREAELYPVDRPQNSAFKDEMKLILTQTIVGLASEDSDPALP